MADPVIQLVEVSRTFHDFWGRPRVRAVEGLSLDIAPGELLGLLGPNGAGKSTTIKLILGLLRPTSGRLSVFGRDPRDPEVRRRTGYLPEETKLHRFLTAAETLDFFGSLIGLERAERKRRTAALLEMVGLARAADRRVGEMSKGMARRIGLAVALVGDPDLVVLDEPTSGLDPIGTREVKDLIVALAARGKTVLLCSHLLADVEDACHRVAILYGGKVRALGPTRELLAQDGRVRIELDRPGPEALAGLEAAARAASSGGAVTIGAPTDRLEAFFLRVVEQAQAAGADTGGARSGGAVAGFLGGRDRAHPAAPAAVAAPPTVAAPAAVAAPVAVAAPATVAAPAAVAAPVAVAAAAAAAPVAVALVSPAPVAAQVPAAAAPAAPALERVAPPSPEAAPPSSPAAVGKLVAIGAPGATAGTPVEPARTAHAGEVGVQGALPAFESLRPRAPAPAAPPLENPKTRAVLDRLLKRPV